MLKVKGRKSLGGMGNEKRVTHTFHTRPLVSSAALLALGSATPSATLRVQSARTDVQLLEPRALAGKNALRPSAPFFLSTAKYIVYVVDDEHLTFSLIPLYVEDGKTGERAARLFHSRARALSCRSLTPITEKGCCGRTMARNEHDVICRRLADTALLRTNTR